MKGTKLIIHSKNKDLVYEVPPRYFHHLEEIPCFETLKRYICGNVIITDQPEIVQSLYEAGAGHVFLGPNFWPELRDYFLRESTQDFFNDKSSFITANPSFKKDISRCLETLKRSQIPLLLTGRTGTGKTYLAKNIHHYLNPNASFIAKNIREIPENLIESTLFGSKKGSFTGADRDTVGLLEKINGGTLFLDEISGLNCDLQIKLLKVLEEKEFSPIGSQRVIKTNFRLITATCDSLEGLLKQKKLRLDFYYRIKGLTLNCIDLHKRPEDLRMLIKLWQNNQSRQYYFTPETLDQMESYPWPGNIRELKYYLESLKGEDKSVITTFRFAKELYLATTNEDLPSAISKLENKLFKESYLRNKGRPNRICQELNISKSVYYRLQKTFANDNQALPISVEHCNGL
jgi:transcriptional regulator with PAS, ATPase and Fis domain